MTFEIEKYEGWGRTGRAFGKEGFITPNIIIPRFFSNNSLLTSFKDQKNTNQLPYEQKHPNYEMLGKTDLGLLPSCFVYPSLQTQGKSLEDINCFDDFFPVDISKNSTQKPSFHLIPWDLPIIFLNRFEVYLQTLNKLEDPKLDPHTKLVLNLPLTTEILEKDLPYLKAPAISVISLGDLSSLLTNPRLLIKYLKRLKTLIPPDRMIYAPGVPSSFIPILAYLGIDLYDLLYIKMLSITPDRQLDFILEQKVTVESFLQVLHLVRRGLEIGKLRDLTRIFANSFPPLKALLRISDLQISLEEGTPLYGSRTLYCTDETDFSRPEVFRFRERVKTRYYPPSHITGVIFLPCSAKKPYSQSKSHKLFQKVLRQTLKGRRYSIEEIILTSPLGVVPRNLEYSFPAAHYDIPVTGKWSQIEKKHLTKDLTEFIKKIALSVPLVGYVKGVERKILKKVCISQNRSINLITQDIKSLTSEEALQEFVILLEESFSNSTNNIRIPNLLVFLRAIADFQFGKGIGKSLVPKNAKISGRKELGIKVQIDGKHHLMFRPDTGYLTISLTAGHLLLGRTKNEVTFDGEKIKGSTIFANAIIKADPEIRPKDEVLVTNGKGELIAVGVSHLPGNLLVKMQRGKGISIRQKVK
ncbi:MAG: DUF5591 domain-containing protein [Promethearchaeota archaeon]